MYNKDNIISGFKYDYFFLSNFYPVNVTYLGITYQSAEAAFQAQKTADRKHKELFVNMSAVDAKRVGKKLNLIPGWDQIKLDIMYEICKAKFDQNESLIIDLLNTNDAYLQEENHWNDTYWGTVNGVGENHLGKILMRIRGEYNDTITD